MHVDAGEALKSASTNPLRSLTSRQQQIFFLNMKALGSLPAEGDACFPGNLAIHLASALGALSLRGPEESVPSINNRLPEVCNRRSEEDLNQTRSYIDVFRNLSPYLSIFVWTDNSQYRRLSTIAPAQLRSRTLIPRLIFCVVKLHCRASEQNQAFSSLGGRCSAAIRHSRSFVLHCAEMDPTKSNLPTILLLPGVTSY